jgi:hypothetical protein
MTSTNRTAATRPPATTRPRPLDSTTTMVRRCLNPIRLRGFYQMIEAQTGQVLAAVGSPEAGDGVLLVSCKDRRANSCGPCSRLYEKDAFHLLAAGLRGGKSVPASVGTHPAVMLTLTAPSFGVVHGNRDRGRACRCGQVHGEDDLRIGSPVDPQAYRYVDQVIWNRYAPRLWKRTVLAIRRGLAQALGVPRSKLSEVAHVRFAKVVEFQRRGVVHYHAIIRVDGPSSADSPPPAACTTQLLTDVVESAAQTTTVAVSDALSVELMSGMRAALRWGAQREVDVLDQQTCTAAAGYIAKYATKATETATGGTLVKPIRSRRQLEDLPLTEHARALISASLTVAERTGIEGFKRWAHQFGYGGHTLTKSHDYSVTFAALRAARASWRRGGDDQAEMVIRSKLSYAGRGCGPDPSLTLVADDVQAGLQPRPRNAA